MGQPQWGETLERALSAFPTTPYILQEFRKARRVRAEYHDPLSDEIIEMPGRVRLSPYYFVSDDAARLGGILATVVPLDKKLIHGMTDAVMVPCALGSDTLPTEREEPS
jgi:hypothetical protein